ncbi:sialate O-acetylesterase [Pedobacter sp.]|uniref:sialate O-acetylesterase n=1 Tax=Pedobacter sp. TaxID=1411316 RepID=UPI003D7FF396
MINGLWMKKYLLLTAFIAMTMTLNAKVQLPRILSGNMVLQRDKPLNIWGFAAPGETVTVSFAGQNKSTVTDAAGKWAVILTPLATSSKPGAMVIKGTNEIILENILVGEVWLCSGQSNMEYAMRKLAKIEKPLKENLGFPANEVAKAKNTQIRIFLVNRKTLSKPDSTHQSWSIAQDSALRSFSAVGYFFAKELQEKLGIPVGIISSAVSGSAIEPWIAQDSFKQEAYFAGEKIGNDPGKFYNPMIEPLTNFAIRGFLWYQGETNCFLRENISYAYKIKTLIKSWRAAWKDDELPFYAVQIAPFSYSKSKGKLLLDENTLPEFWEAQAQVLRMKNTGLVVTTDLNDHAEDLHPTYKWEVGRRLALWALAKDYGQKISYTGPVYTSMKIKGSKVILNFDHAGDGLYSNDGQQLSGFTIAGADGNFVPAAAVVKGNTVIVSSIKIKTPKAARFSWNENGHANFYNKNGLPAMPFRTDNPLTPQFNVK